MVKNSLSCESSAGYGLFVVFITRKPVLIRFKRNNQSARVTCSQWHLNIVSLFSPYSIADASETFDSLSVVKNQLRPQFNPRIAVWDRFQVKIGLCDVAESAAAANRHTFAIAC